MVDEPIFHSLDAALAFAYRIEWSSTHPTSQMGKLHMVRWKPEYTVAELHAQAQMIQSHVNNKLSRAERAFIECKYRFGPRRFQSLDGVVTYVAALAGGKASSRRMVRELCHRFYTGTLTYAAIAKMVGCDVKTLDKYNKRVIAALSALCARAEDPLVSDFRAGGLIP